MPQTSNAMICRSGFEQEQRIAQLDCNRARLVQDDAFLSCRVPHLTTVMTNEGGVA